MTDTQPEANTSEPTHTSIEDAAALAEHLREIADEIEKRPPTTVMHYTSKTTVPVLAEDSREVLDYTSQHTRAMFAISWSDQ